MAKQRKGRSNELYETYKVASGWYLAAWRDWRGLTLDELAAETGITKGYISDLESGAAREGRPMKRFNRDMIDSMARALDTTGGRLIDVNPFTVDDIEDRFDSVIRRLDAQQRDAVLQLAKSLGGKTGTDG